MTLPSSNRSSVKVAAPPPPLQQRAASAAFARERAEARRQVNALLEQESRQAEAAAVWDRVRGRLGWGAQQ